MANSVDMHLELASSLHTDRLNRAQQRTDVAFAFANVSPRRPVEWVADEPGSWAGLKVTAVAIALAIVVLIAMIAQPDGSSAASPRTFNGQATTAIAEEGQTTYLDARFSVPTVPELFFYLAGMSS